MGTLRICHVIHNTDVGGTEVMLYQLLRQLTREHADFAEHAVVSLMDCGVMGDRIRELGVPVHAMHCARLGRPRPSGLWGAIEYLRSQQPDVVQTWAYHADLVGGVIAKLTTRAAVIWNVRHATLEPGLESRNVLRTAWLCGRLGKIPDQIVLNSHAAIAAHHRKGYPLPKMQVIPNGFDLNRFQRQPNAASRLRAELGIRADAELLGMAGRYHPHKGQFEFLQMATRVAVRRPHAHFVIAGARCTPENNELAGWIDEMQLAGRVHLMGPQDDMPSWLSGLDLFVLPSRTEAMPNVLGEAIACEVPCVATDVGDVSYLMGPYGTLVRSGDMDGLAAAACRMLSTDSAVLREQAQGARQRLAKHYDIKQIAKSYAALWLQVAATRSVATRSVGMFPATAVTSNELLAQAEPTSGLLHLPANERYVRSLAFAGADLGSDDEPTTETRRPKLVHVTTIPMTQWLFLRGQNTYMKQQGFEVHAVSSPGDDMVRLAQRDGIETHSIPISRRIQPLRDTISIWRLWWLFRRLRPEIVQLSTPKAALLGSVAAWVARVPVRIYQIRGLSSESESGWRRHLYQRGERWTARLCNACLVNATSLLRHAQQVGIIQHGWVAGSGMSNGVDLAMFDPTTVRATDLRRWDPHWREGDGPVIGFVGRLTRDKGLEDLHQAWQRLRNDFRTARLLLVGPWEAENSADHACRNDLIRDPRVIVVGRQDNVAPFYKVMDLFVFPSHGTEGFPNAPMEAAAMQLPVVATRVVGCIDAVEDGVTGTLIEPQNVDELTAAIRQYLDSPSQRMVQGRAGRARVEQGFAPENLWAAFRDFYVTRLQEYGLPVPATAEQATQPERRRAA